MSSEQSEPMPSDDGAVHERLRGADKMLSLRVDAIEDDIKEHGKRLSALERWQWFCYGLAAAVGALATQILRGFGLKNE